MMKAKSAYLEKTGKILKKLIESHGDKILNVLGKANTHILETFGDGFVAGAPQKVTLFNKCLWIVPINMANSKQFRGEVGVIAIDGETLEILGISEFQDIQKRIQWLAHEQTEVV